MRRFGSISKNSLCFRDINVRKFINNTERFVPKLIWIVERKLYGLSSIVDADAGVEKHFVDRPKTKGNRLYLLVEPIPRQNLFGHDFADMI